MDKAKKRIGMIAPIEDRQGLVDWARYNKPTLEKAIIYTTYETGGELERDVGLKVEKEADVVLNNIYPLRIQFKSSSKGGDMEIGCLLVEGKLDCLFYFWNSAGKEPHDEDIKAVLRHSVNQNIPTACNRNTADHLISSPYFDKANSNYPPHEGVVNIALVAHDGKKDELMEWVQLYKSVLGKHNLFATGTTGGRIIKETGLKVNKMKSGPKGGDMEISTLITNKDLDCLVFFWDPEEAQPHDVDVKALLRNAVYYNVAIACNPATANHIITSNLFPKKLYERSS